MFHCSIYLPRAFNYYNSYYCLLLFIFMSHFCNTTWSFLSPFHACPSAFFFLFAFSYLFRFLSCVSLLSCFLVIYSLFSFLPFFRYLIDTWHALPGFFYVFLFLVQFPHIIYVFVFNRAKLYYPNKFRLIVTKSKRDLINGKRIIS